MCVCINPLFQILAGVLSALLKSAEALASEQARTDTLKIVEQIDGHADVEELVERNVHRTAGTGGGSTTPRGRGDGIGEASVSREDVERSMSLAIRQANTYWNIGYYLPTTPEAINRSRTVIDSYSRNECYNHCIRYTRSGVKQEIYLNTVFFSCHQQNGVRVSQCLLAFR